MVAERLRHALEGNVRRLLIARQIQIGIRFPAIAAYPARSEGNESPVSEVAQGDDGLALPEDVVAALVGQAS
jgi:hypothetical protein